MAQVRVGGPRDAQYRRAVNSQMEVHGGSWNVFYAVAGMPPGKQVNTAELPGQDRQSVAAKANVAVRSQSEQVSTALYVPPVLPDGEAVITSLLDGWNVAVRAWLKKAIESQAEQGQSPQYVLTSALPPPGAQLSTAELPGRDARRTAQAWAAVRSQAEVTPGTPVGGGYFPGRYFDKLYFPGRYFPIPAETLPPGEASFVMLERTAELEAKRYRAIFASSPPTFDRTPPPAAPPGGSGAMAPPLLPVPPRAHLEGLSWPSGPLALSTLPPGESPATDQPGPRVVPRPTDGSAPSPFLADVSLPPGEVSDALPVFPVRRAIQPEALGVLDYRLNEPPPGEQRWDPPVVPVRRAIQPEQVPVADYRLNEPRAIFAGDPPNPPLPNRAYLEVQQGAGLVGPVETLPLVGAQSWEMPVRPGPARQDHVPPVLDYRLNEPETASWDALPPSTWPRSRAHLEPAQTSTLDYRLSEPPVASWTALPPTSLPPRSRAYLEPAQASVLDYVLNEPRAGQHSELPSSSWPRSRAVLEIQQAAGLVGPVETLPLVGTQSFELPVFPTPRRQDHVAGTPDYVLNEPSVGRSIDDPVRAVGARPWLDLVRGAPPFVEAPFVPSATDQPPRPIAPTLADVAAALNYVLTSAPLPLGAQLSTAELPGRNDLAERTRRIAVLATDVEGTPVAALSSLVTATTVGSSETELMGFDPAKLARAEAALRADGLSASPPYLLTAPAPPEGRQWTALPPFPAARAVQVERMATPDCLVYEPRAREWTEIPTRPVYRQQPELFVRGPSVAGPFAPMTEPPIGRRIAPRLADVTAGLNHVLTSPDPPPGAQLSTAELPGRDDRAARASRVALMAIDVQGMPLPVRDFIAFVLNPGVVVTELMGFDERRARWSRAAVRSQDELHALFPPLITIVNPRAMTWTALPPSIWPTSRAHLEPAQTSVLDYVLTEPPIGRLDYALPPGTRPPTWRPEREWAPPVPPFVLNELPPAGRILEMPIRPEPPRQDWVQGSFQPFIFELIQGRASFDLPPRGRPSPRIFEVISVPHYRLEEPPARQWTENPPRGLVRRPDLDLHVGARGPLVLATLPPGARLDALPPIGPARPVPMEQIGVADYRLNVPPAATWVELPRVRPVARPSLEWAPPSFLVLSTGSAPVGAREIAVPTRAVVRAVGLDDVLGVPSFRLAEPRAGSVFELPKTADRRRSELEFAPAAFSPLALVVAPAGGRVLELPPSGPARIRLDWIDSIPDYRLNVPRSLFVGPERLLVPRAPTPPVAEAEALALRVAVLPVGAILDALPPRGPGRAETPTPEGTAPWLTTPPAPAGGASLALPARLVIARADLGLDLVAPLSLALSTLPPGGILDALPPGGRAPLRGDALVVVPSYRLTEPRPFGGASEPVPAGRVPPRADWVVPSRLTLQVGELPAGERLLEVPVFPIPPRFDFVGPTPAAFAIVPGGRVLEMPVRAVDRRVLDWLVSTPEAFASIPGRALLEMPVRRIPPRLDWTWSIPPAFVRVPGAASWAMPVFLTRPPERPVMGSPSVLSAIPPGGRVLEIPRGAIPALQPESPGVLGVVVSSDRLPPGALAVELLGFDAAGARKRRVALIATDVEGTPAPIAASVVVLGTVGRQVTDLMGFDEARRRRAHASALAWSRGDQTIFVLLAWIPCFPLLVEIRGDGTHTVEVLGSGAMTVELLGDGMHTIEIVCTDDP